MKKYKAILEQKIVKVVFISASSQADAERKAKEVEWRYVGSGRECHHEYDDKVQHYNDEWSNLKVTKCLDDEEVLMDILRADEGWVITYGIPDDTYRIDKEDDHLNPFKDDICAIQFVIENMLKGSMLHIRAFRFAYANGSEDDRKVLQEELHYAILSK